ncbi:MAG TPA: UDP-N-acetylmuramate dehydrogenase [Candidatus Saccharibacteria bacterium]|nr:UDP-N-acetylmuramate dehydrogenase [Candidatus Saccharibacteria bacterium]
MDIHTNIPLKNYTTMKLGGNARFLADILKPEDIPNLLATAAQQSLPVAILGGGSNTIVHDEGYNGLVLRIRIPGITTIAEDLNTVTIKVGAGEPWDNVVKYTVDLRLTGIEAMSAIPGTAGAAPVQNVGAYGQEVADTLVSLEVYDTETNTFVTLTNDQCRFSYRNSIFRDEARGRYIITSITLQLSKNLPSPPFYDALQRYLDENNIATYTHQTIRDAVIAIRKEKLPDPVERPNAGSFFKNAIIESWQLPDIQAIDPDVPTYDMGDGRYKIPTGWLIEKTGLKGQLLHGMRIHDKNALVLINESATSYEDLAKARDEITTMVRAMFRVEISQEPLELPS